MSAMNRRRVVLSATAVDRRPLRRACGCVGYRSLRRPLPESDHRDPRDRQAHRRIRAPKAQCRRNPIQIGADRRRRRATVARQYRFLHGRRTGGAAAQLAADRIGQPPAARGRERRQSRPYEPRAEQQACSRKRSTRSSTSRCASQSLRCRRCISRFSAATCSRRRRSPCRRSDGDFSASRRPIWSLRC